MNDINQTLNAYIDNELDYENKQAFENKLKNDPELQKQLKKLIKVNEALSISYPLDNSIPESMLNTILSNSQPNNIVSIEERKSNKSENKLVKNWYPSAIAASITLALGVLFGNYFVSSSHNDDILLSTTITPDNALFEVLENSPSTSEVNIDTPNDQNIIVHPVLSFKNNKGNYCREFDVVIKESISIGIACRVSDSRWNMEVLLHTDKIVESKQSYSLASGYDEDTIKNVIDSLIVGDPIHPEKEASLIDNNWK